MSFLANVCVSVLGWYISSISISVINKVTLDSIGFSYPLFVTLTHFTLVSFVLKLGFQYGILVPPISSFLSPSQFMTRIFPIGLLTAMEIATSNMAYPLVSLSFMTVMKSTIIVTTYLFALLLVLDHFDFFLFLSIILIIGGVYCAASDLEIHNNKGLILLSISVVMSGLRWTFVHKVLNKEGYTPLQLMMLTQPVAAIILAPSVVGMEMRRLLSSDIDYVTATIVATLVCLSVILVFLLLYTELKIIVLTSCVTLTVAGVGKEILTITSSMAIFHEQVEMQSAAGICMHKHMIMKITVFRYDA